MSASGGHDLDLDMFRRYNPFCANNLTHDCLFIEYAKMDMLTYLNQRGCIFVDDVPIKQVTLYYQFADEENAYWVEANGMMGHFHLKGDDDLSRPRMELTYRSSALHRSSSSLATGCDPHTRFPRGVLSPCGSFRASQ